LVKIFEENKPVFDREDRSEWTEEQWKEDKEKNIKRKELIKTLAMQKVEDKEKLQTFFEKLDEHKKEFKAAMHKKMNDYLKRLAKKAGLSDLEFDRFMIVQNANKANVHWRIGMHKNEKRKAFKQLKASWEIVKNKVLDGCDEKEAEKFKKFFSVVEADFNARRHGRQHERRHHGHHSEEVEGVEHHHRRHGCHKRHWRSEEDSEEYKPHHRHHEEDRGERIRHHRRHRYHDDESEEEPRHHRRHHRHHSEDDSDDFTPRRRHHRRHHEQSDDDSQEFRPRHRHHRRHHDQSSEEDTPVYRGAHRRPHHHRQRDEDQDERVPVKIHLFN